MAKQADLFQFPIANDDENSIIVKYILDKP